MGLFDRFLRRPGPRTPGFQLVLPDGPWREDHEPTHYDYGSEERGEQLTIVVAHTQRPLDNPALFLAVLELVAARQRALLAVSEGAARFEELRSDGRLDRVSCPMGLLVDRDLIAKSSEQCRLHTLSRALGLS